MDLSDKVPQKKARIEIVPLIDCMFLLLVFFVYSMMTMTQPRGIPVNLPPATDAPAETKESLSVSITGTGEIYLDKEQVDLDALAAGIAAAHASNPALRVLINGDRDARHGVVVEVLDVLRRLNVQHVAIETGPPEKIERK